MDANTNEYYSARTEPNATKFIHYKKKVNSLWNTAKNRDDPIIPNETSGESKKKHSRYTSDGVIQINHLCIPQLQGLSSKMPHNLYTAYSSQDIRNMPLGSPNSRSRLTVLDLSNTNLEVFPVDILNYSLLRILRLDHNRIRELPFEITRLTKLETLTISFNKLVCLPWSLSNLGQLQELNLESNSIENISDEFVGLKELKILNICQNQLAYLPCSMKELVGLKEFNCEWFNYTKPRLCALQKGKEGVQNIEKLRAKLAELWKKKVKGMSFRYFLDFFSTERVYLTGVDGLGRTMLHYAALNQDLSVIRYLAANVPELKNVLDKDELSPFTLSLLNDKLRSVEYLLSQGVDLMRGGGKYGSPFHIAAKKLNLNVLKQMIIMGGDLNRIDILGNTPLHYAISAMTDSYDRSTPIVQFLLENNLNPNAKNKENWTPLHLITRKGEIRSLEWIINYNLEVKEVYGGDQLFDLNKRGGAFKWTSLHIAAYTGSSRMINLLGEAGADFFKTSAHGYKPKSMARRNGLALKLMEKYEKEFIKKNVLNKDTSNLDCSTNHIVQCSTHKKEIKGASKNRFKENSYNINSYRNGEMVKPNFSVFGKSPCTIMGASPTSKVHSKRQIGDSFEITPETETGLADSYEDNIITEMEGIADLCIDNESVNIDADLYLFSGPLSDKGRNTAFNTSQMGQSRTIKQKNNANLIFDTDLDIGSYKKKLQSQQGYGLEYFRSELNSLSDIMINNKLAVSEKLKLLLAMKVLHTVIADYIYKKFAIPVRKELLTLLLLNSSAWKSPRYDPSQYFRKEEGLQIIQLCELVPQRMISIFWTLEDKDPKNYMIKQNICKILGDIRYFSGMDFYKKVSEDKRENLFVVQEAKHTYSNLKTVLETTDPQVIHQALLKKQYAKTLSTKVTFPSQLKVLKGT